MTVELKPLSHYETQALIYAEKRGIVQYSVNGGVMTYKVSYPMERATYTVRVNLDTMLETSRTENQRYYKKYAYNGS